MNADLLLVAMGVMVLTINCTTMILTFPGKRSLFFTISALTLFSIFFYAILYFAGIMVPDNGGLPGLLYLPIMLLLFEGRLFHKVFAYFLQFSLTSFQVTLAQTISEVIMRYDERMSKIVFPMLLLTMFTVYIAVVFKYGRHFFEKLFEYGRLSEWAMYSFGAVFSFVVLTISQIAPYSIWYMILLLLFILWSFAVLCFAIINAQEKAKLKYEAEFAQDVISSGSEHYEKMNELLEALRVMRHDYKYHLDTISELLSSGDEFEAKKYLSAIKKDLAEKELPVFCSNAVLNALLSSYSERCVNLNIKLSVEISMPESISIPNYEMCIVLGNLLENALCACETKKDGRKIDLVINTQGVHLAVMVKNTYDGDIIQGDDMLVSKKKDGGIGIRSVQAVAARYGGELMNEWDGSSFSAYVLLRL